MKKIGQTISSLEVAEMVGKRHDHLMRDIKKYINEMAAPNLGEGTESNIASGEFFQESTYKDANNQNRPCYQVTKKGCEFIAHKLTGIKGTEFTAKYINRFHDMEDTISKGIPQREKKKNSQLSSINMMAKNITDIFTKAGVEPVLVAAEVKRLYKEQADIDIQIPLLTDKETMPKLYDCTEIAKELGIMSKSGKPHNQAVGDIIRMLDITDEETKTTAFSRNGHGDVTVQFLPSVVEKVMCWLKDNQYPTKIPSVDSMGNSKIRTVVYR